MTENETKEKDYTKGFRDAWRQLRIGEAAEAKATIKDILGVRSEPAFSLYRAGKQGGRGARCGQRSGEAGAGGKNNRLFQLKRHRQCIRVTPD